MSFDQFDFNYSDADNQANAEILRQRLSAMMVEEVRFVHRTNSGPNAECQSRLIRSGYMDKSEGKQSSLGNKESRYSFTIKAMVPEHAEWSQGYYNRWYFAAMMGIYVEWTEQHTESQTVFEKLWGKIQSDETPQVSEEPSASLEINVPTLFGTPILFSDASQKSITEAAKAAHVYFSGGSSINGLVGQSQNTEMNAKLDQLIDVVKTSMTNGVPRRPLRTVRPFNPTYQRKLR